MAAGDRRPLRSAFTRPTLCESPGDAIHHAPAGHLPPPFADLEQVFDGFTHDSKGRCIDLTYHRGGGRPAVLQHR